MKKIDLEKELDSVQYHKGNKSVISKSLLPICLFFLVVCIGVSFSSPSDQTYNVRIDIINGYESLFLEDAKPGVFSTYIDGYYDIGSISCDNSTFKYDYATRIVSGEVRDKDVNCTLEFDVSSRNDFINTEGLIEIVNNGLSDFYFKKNSINNYFSYNNELYRIIKVDKDKNIMLIKEDKVAEGIFNEEDIKSILDDWIYINNIPNLVDNNSIEDQFNFEQVHSNKVSLINSDEIRIICGEDCSDSYLKGNYYINNDSEERLVIDNDKLTNYSEKSYDIRPVITIKVEDIFGNGTIYSPYKMEE